MPNNTEFRLTKKSCNNPVFITNSPIINTQLFSGLANNSCDCPVLITNSQRRNPSLFSGSSNNPSFLTTNSFIYSSLSNKRSRSSRWINKQQTVENRFIPPLSNKII